MFVLLSFFYGHYIVCSFIYDFLLHLSYISCNEHILKYLVL